MNDQKHAIKRTGECDHCHNYVGDLVPICDFSKPFYPVIDSCCQDCYDKMMDAKCERS